MCLENIKKEVALNTELWSSLYHSHPTPYFKTILLLLGDQQGQPPASIGCEAQRQPTTNCTCAGIHIQAVGQGKPHLMSGLQQGRVFNRMEAINLAFPAVWDCYVVLRGKSALSSWSCNNITERMLCDMANYPLFPPLNTTRFIHARKQI